MTIEIISFSTTPFKGVDSDRILRLNGGHHLFNTAAERRRVAKLLKRGLSLGEALRYVESKSEDTPQVLEPKSVDTPQVVEQEAQVTCSTDQLDKLISHFARNGKVNVQQQRVELNAAELENLYEDPAAGMNPYDAFIENFITYDEMPAEYQEFADEARQDGFDIFGSYESIISMYNKAKDLDLWYYFDAYAVNSVVSLELDEIDWLKQLGLHELSSWDLDLHKLSSWDVDELLPYADQDPQYVSEMWELASSSHLSLDVLMNIELPTWVDTNQLSIALYYSNGDVTEAFESIITAYCEGWEDLAVYYEVGSQITSEDYDLFAEIVDHIEFLSNSIEKSTRVLLYSEMLEEVDISSVINCLNSLIIRGTMLIPSEFRDLLDWKGSIRQDVIESWKINTVDDLLNHQLYQALENGSFCHSQGLYSYNMKWRVEKAIKEACSIGLTHFDTLEEALSSEICQMFEYSLMLCVNGDYMDEDDYSEDHERLSRELPYWLTRQFYKALDSLVHFDQVTTAKELYEHPLFTYTKKNGTTLYRELTDRFGFYRILESFEDAQANYVEEKKQEFLKGNFGDSWLIVAGSTAVLPELEHYLSEVKAVFRTDLNNSFPCKISLDLEDFDVEATKSTEVVPYKGHTAISCSNVRADEDYKWTVRGSKVWASARGCISSYGSNAVLALVDTRKGKAIEYRYGSHSDKWVEEKAYGISHNYDSHGAICFDNRLTKQLIELGNSSDLSALLEEGGFVKIGGKKGYAQVNNCTWHVLFEDGTLVKGNRGLPELAAYAKGLVKTEQEVGLPKAQLFMVRLVMIALGFAKKAHSNSSARAAGYEWLGHYALGTGAAKQFPKEWLTPIMSQIESNTDSAGRFFIPSDAWSGQGFNQRPHGFYTIGGFSGQFDKATGMLSFEDIYDWHPMERTSPQFGSTETVWCWSEFTLPTVSLEELARYLPKSMQSLFVKALHRWAITEISLNQWAEEFLGPQYIGDSDFFGVYGISNKLWADLEHVGAKPFKTVFKDIV